MRFGAITNPTSWLRMRMWSSFFFSYYSAARDAILYLFKRTLAFGCCQNRVTLCARGAAALCMRLFCGYWVSMIYGPGVCVFGMRAHGTGWLHSILQPYLRWQVIKIWTLEHCDPLNCQNSLPLSAVPTTTLQLQFPLKGYSKNTDGKLRTLSRAVKPQRAKN